MQEFLEKFKQIEAESAREKGAFNLFALLQREDAFAGQWDLVVAAPWIGEGRWEIIEYLVSKIQLRLDAEELRKLATIVPVPVDDEPVQRLIRAFPTSGEAIEIRDWDYRGMPIARGYILTARPTPEAIATPNAAAAG
jgi:hypothetical protein